MWTRLLKRISIITACLAVALSLYCWHLSTQIERRFSARRWSIPSRVFSDITVLYPGQKTNRGGLYEKLLRLGYREVAHPPERAGEMRILSSVLDLYLHELKTPSGKREGFAVQIRFLQDRIASIVRMGNGEAVPVLELEPEELMSFFGQERERRQVVSIDEVPRHLIQAILAIEDSRFYRHHGFDSRGILRAFCTNLRHRGIRQGGSTITQQIAKNYFLTPERTLRRKLKELLMSLIMEVMYDKNEILEIYLNEIYLGQKASVAIHGVGEASHFYFGKSVSELSLSEAASIAGIIKAPNQYSPYVDDRRCTNRRNLVLHAMHGNGWITDEELQGALASPISTVGFYVHDSKAPYFMDYLSEQLTVLYAPEFLTSLGLSIYTSLDTQVQTAAKEALRRGLARLEGSNLGLRRLEPEKRLQGAIVVMQPKTGYILAMVGGRDYGVSQFNRIAKARRQPGSAFKPFVFVSALDELTPASMLSNEPKSYVVDGESWQPHNYLPVSDSKVSLRTALAKSINLATVDLAMQVGLERIVSTATAFGFSTPIKAFPSLALGAFEVIPLELARAYCVFAADGVQPYPLSLREVLDENGKILERRHMSINRIISPEKAFIITSILQSAVAEGTAHVLKDLGISFPVAGKTGTTNGFRDAWFVGYTPDILALVWVGFDDGDEIHTPGSAAALPIWADLMKAIPQHVSGDWFKMPPGVVRRIVCSESGYLAIPYACPKSVEEVFLADKVPLRECPIHQSVGPFKRMIKRLEDLLP